MSTLNQLRQGLNEAWDSVVDGWQRLYGRASDAITRFTSGNQEREAGRDITLRNVGWGVLAAEVFDDDGKVVVRLEAPGMDKSDFDLELLDNYLVVRGEKKVERERTEGRYHVTECAYGRFERAIPLPDEVDSRKASAKYRNGVLRIELPRTGSRRRQPITVNIG